MNDEDLRDLFAGLAMLGMLASGKKNVESTAYFIADNMIEEKYAERSAQTEPDVGIAAIKRKYIRKEKPE